MTQLDPTLSASSLPKTVQAPQAATAPAAGHGFSFTFHDFLSIINPLQHLPVIGTLYRAVTGDTIGVPEKIAGDALYGGLWGAVSGVADAAFQAVTGKDFGDTVLSLLTGNHGAAATQLAANTPSTAAIAAQASASLAAVMPAINAGAVPSSAGIGQLSASSAAVGQSSNPDFLALATSLSQKGVDSSLAQRALFAYQKSMALPASMLVPAQ